MIIILVFFLLRLSFTASLPFSIISLFVFVLFSSSIITVLRQCNEAKIAGVGDACESDEGERVVQNCGPSSPASSGA